MFDGVLGHFLGSVRFCFRVSVMLEICGIYVLWEISGICFGKCSGDDVKNMPRDIVWERCGI